MLLFFGGSLIEERESEWLLESSSFSISWDLFSFWELWLDSESCSSFSFSISICPNPPKWNLPVLFVCFIAVLGFFGTKIGLVISESLWMSRVTKSKKDN